MFEQAFKNIDDILHKFVLFKYIDTGFEELDQSRLPKLIELKYSSITDGMDKLGGVNEVRNLFIGFQKHLYQSRTKL